MTMAINKLQRSRLTFDLSAKALILEFHMKTPYNKLAKIYANWFLLQNQKADDLGTWYVTFGTWGLPSLFK